MAKGRKETVAVPDIKPEHVRMAFQNVAEACGGDILQACKDMGEPEEIDRDGLWDYLEIHGGNNGKQVSQWITAYLKNHSIADLNRTLDRFAVPRTWT